MTNDTPFVPLPSPPVDPTQPAREALKRGYDRDDEHARAIAYKEHLRVMAHNRIQVIKSLRGNRVAAENLLRKTVALTTAPPYVETD